MTPPSADIDAVRLRGGARVAIRPIDAADKARVTAAFAELSPVSRHRRFFTPLEALDDERLRSLTVVLAAGTGARAAIAGPR
jgi:hypothetical protein